MKKYLLKLIDEDIKIIKIRINSYANTILDDRFKDDQYFNRKLESEKNKLKNVFKYKERVNKL